jgi:hypothetical protein
MALSPTQYEINSDLKENIGKTKGALMARYNLVSGKSRTKKEKDTNNTIDNCIFTQGINLRKLNEVERIESSFEEGGKLMA